MRKNFPLLGGLFILVILAGAGCNNRRPEPVNPNNQTSTQLESTTTVTSPVQSSSTEPAVQPKETAKPDTGSGAEVVVSAGLTAADVAKHNTKTDCYIIVRTSVYNVSAFIDRHPGGPEKILPLCGKDATAAFTGQHGGMQMQESTLASLKVGDLKK